MSQPIPSAVTIANRIITDIESKINQTTPSVQKAFNRVIAIVESGEFTALYRYLLDQKKQIFPQDADEESLTKWGEIVNENRETPTAAVLTCTATGTNGTIIQSGSSGPRWISENGIVYFNQSSETIAGGTATLSLECIEGGEIGNQEIGTELTITASQAGLDDIVTVTAIASSGVDEQSLEEYRAEVVLKFKRPPQGGAPADYFFWATDRPNIVDAYPYAGSLPGETNLYIVAGDQPDGIPTAAQITDVYNYIDSGTRLPLWSEDLLPDGSTARFSVLASPVESFITTISGLNPSTQTLIDAVEDALITFYATRRPYIRGISTEREGEISQNKLRSIVQEQIDLNNGIGFTDVTFALTSNPSGLLTSYSLVEGTRTKTTVAFT
jgi:uncharacterized phage protein gp47/JayE